MFFFFYIARLWSLQYLSKFQIHIMLSINYTLTIQKLVLNLPWSILNNVE